MNNYGLEYAKSKVDAIKIMKALYMFLKCKYDDDPSLLTNDDIKECTLDQIQLAIDMMEERVR